MTTLDRNPVLTVLARLPITSVLSDLETGVIIWASAPDPGIIGAGSTDEVFGRNLLDFIDPTQHATALRDLEAVGRGASPPPVVYHLRGLHGGIADVQIASVRMSIADKPAMLSLITDVTSSERACREREESEERYRELVDSSPDGIAVVEANRVVFANRTLVEALGASSVDEVVGESMYRFIHPDDHDGVRAARGRIIRYGKPHSASPVMLVRLDGTTIQTTAQTSLVHWSGEPATQTIMRDLANAGR